MSVCPYVPALLAFLTSATAFAQSTNYTSVEAVAGTAAQIGYYASAKKDCAPAPLPTIRVLTPPKHGILSIRRGTVTTNRVANCPSLQTPAQVVFYQGNADYQGADELAYEVTSSNGEVGVYNISVAVKPAVTPAPSTPGQRL